MGFESKERYDKGDLVLIDDEKGFKEIVVVLSCRVPMYHRAYEFYQVFSVTEGHVYIVPCSLVKGQIKV